MGTLVVWQYYIFRKMTYDLLVLFELFSMRILVKLWQILFVLNLLFIILTFFLILLGVGFQLLTRTSASLIL